ncbi:DUF1905 domain-containing protein [Brachybacterium sp. JHP9]|uniref:DUF1905 domain-containing protein n=1 Tax=Brachybacterium equifaecis TaxID=2910770 RepID=A0ABT0R2N7_9MICO|nr:DUF1905 domain-containing protein [Brachybacterium equifaecis]MCL6424200.1 DUF1905 domain-containing protein [Brachybacterium equifaecis]
MDLIFSATAVEWRGPAPYVFAPLPPEEADAIDQVKARLTYGWGVIPVQAQIGETAFTTSLFPREGTYFLPVKVAVQRAEGVEIGDEVEVRVHLDLG